MPTLYRRSGPAPGRVLLLQRLFVEVDHPIVGRTPTPKHSATAAGNTYFIERKMRQYIIVEPDMAKLLRPARLVIPAMGVASADFPDGRAGRAAGQRLLELWHGHVDYVTSSEEFTRRLVRRQKQEAGNGRHLVSNFFAGAERVAAIRRPDEYADRANGLKASGHLTKTCPFTFVNGTSRSLSLDTAATLAAIEDILQDDPDLFQCDHMFEGKAPKSDLIKRRQQRLDFFDQRDCQKRPG
jgi:hypothetical protein